MRVLISVSDKSGIVEFAKELEALGHEIISTGGTYKILIESGVTVREVSEVTNFPEFLDGRVKTLHPAIHGGILAIRDDADHLRQLKERGIEPIDMVVVNLYPFGVTIKKAGVTQDEAMENVDIGGVTLLRAAAKNHKFTASVTDSEDYGKLIKELKENGSICDETRLYLARKAFGHTACYDALIADYLSNLIDEEGFPDTLTVTFEKAMDMRYGENPHQNAAFYKKSLGVEGTIADIKKIHGKELSYNNINDIHGALDLLREFDEPTVVVAKHATPCGVASSDRIFDAYIKAHNSDPVSIFGGVVLSNREIDGETASEMDKVFLEIILATSFTDEAIEILSKKKNLRLLTLADINKKLSGRNIVIKSVSGGVLAQTANEGLIDSLEFVTERKPSDEEVDDMLFAWKIAKHVKSNGIALAKNKQSIGIGSGQVSRIRACRQAIIQGVEILGGSAVENSAMASDAFFPFPDCVEVAAAAGIRAIIHPGGSVNDRQSIDLCNKCGITMAFTGMRHFTH